MPLDPHIARKMDEAYGPDGWNRGDTPIPGSASSTAGQQRAIRWATVAGLFVVAVLALSHAWSVVAVGVFGWPELSVWKVALVLLAWRLAQPWPRR